MIARGAGASLSASVKFFAIELPASGIILGLEGQAFKFSGVFCGIGFHGR